MINQRRYREKLKSGVASKNGSEITHKTYKQSNAKYMKECRLRKKIAVIKTYADTNTETPATKQ